MKSKLTDVVIVGYGRSAVAKSGKKGALRETHPVDLGGLVLRGVLDKIENLPDEAIDDIKQKVKAGKKQTEDSKKAQQDFYEAIVEEMNQVKGKIDIESKQLYDDLFTKKRLSCIWK